MTETVDGVDGFPRLGSVLPATGQLDVWIEFDAFLEQTILDDFTYSGSFRSPSSSRW